MNDATYFNYPELYEMLQEYLKATNSKDKVMTCTKCGVWFVWSTYHKNTELCIDCSGKNKRYIRTEYFKNYWRNKKGARHNNKFKKEVSCER